MCVIAICNRELTLDEFRNCWDNNDDGFGMAWFVRSDRDDNGLSVRVDKGQMDYVSAYCRYLDNMGNINTQPHICHFRLTSVGKTHPCLTHPFVVTSNAIVVENGNDCLEYTTDLPVLFHNGHYADWENLMIMSATEYGFPAGMISDTKILCTTFGLAVEKFGNGILDKLLEKVSGKFVSMVDGHVYMYGEFYESHDRKVNFSNLSFKQRKTVVNVYENGEWI